MTVTSIYKLSAVNEITVESGRVHFTFAVIGVIGKPLVRYSYDDRIAAEKSRLEMMDSITSAVSIEPLFVR
jgi:hypothetical protein